MPPPPYLHDLWSFVSSTDAIVGRNDHSVVCVVYGRYLRTKQSLGVLFRLQVLSSDETIIRSLVSSTDAIIGWNNHWVIHFVYWRYRWTKRSFGRLCRLRTLSSGETVARSLVSSTNAIVKRSSRLATACGGKLEPTTATSVRPFDLYYTNGCQMTYRRYCQAKARMGTTAFGMISRPMLMITATKGRPSSVSYTSYRRKDSKVM